MIDYSDHTIVMTELNDTQDFERERRAAVIEAKKFLVERDGQWEDDWDQILIGQPKYTFDLVTPIINQVAKQVKDSEFTGDVKPISGGATKESAAFMDGLVRNIQVLSDTRNIYGAAGRSMIVGGLDGWEIVVDYESDDTFHQGMMIRDLPNYVDRVWLDRAGENRDGSDANHGWKFTPYTEEAYKERWPEGNAVSMSAERFDNDYFVRDGDVMVAEFKYKKQVKRKLCLMSNGATIEKDSGDYDYFTKVGLTIEEEREVTDNVVYTRMMDGSGWLGDEEETVFKFIPFIPTVCNYEVLNGAKVYFGYVEKRLDPQRSLNYILSREISEAALSPRGKYWMTPEQAAGHEAELATLNTNNDPVQMFNFDPNNPGPPQQSTGTQVNPGLRVMADAMSQMITQGSGMFAANMGDNPGAQSGVALKRLENKGSATASEAFTAQEVAITHTVRILVDTVPRVYLGDREVRVMAEDGTYDVKKMSEVDLTGKYDVTCTAGESYQNRQEEMVDTFLKLQASNPDLAALGGDVFLRNIEAPGMDIIAVRKRALMIQQGIIPIEQMTDDEKQALQQQQEQMANQQQQEDPMMVAARAEQTKAEADMLAQQNKQIELQIKAQDAQARQDLAQLKVRQEEYGRPLNEAEQVADIKNTEADTLKKTIEASGADAVVAPGMIQAIDTAATDFNDGV